MIHVARWLVIFATSVAAVYNKLQCYQCNVDNNALCTDDYLKLCPTDQAYDRCMTSISQSKSSGFSIQKKCALAPCSLRDRDQSSGLGLDDSCDRSRPEYTCIYCCKEDGCNKEAGASGNTAASLGVLMLALLCSLIFLH